MAASHTSKHAVSSRNRLGPPPRRRIGPKGCPHGPANPVMARSISYLSAELSLFRQAQHHFLSWAKTSSS